MANETLNIKIRIEELPTAGKFIRDAFARDLADFTAYSPDFNAAYLADVDLKLTAISALLNPKQLTAELKVITLRMYTNEDLLRSNLDKLEGYVKRAAVLTIAVKDFGISAARVKNNKGDAEGLDSALGFLLTNITNNFTALQAKGYAALQQTELQTIKNQLQEDNAKQNLKLNERAQRVTDNYGVMNDFWAKLIDINDAGKRIYKKTAPKKLPDYTMSALKSKLRQEQKKNKVSGTITSGGKVVNKAKIVMKPVAGGRSKSTYSSAAGKYLVKGLAITDFIVTVTAVGFKPSVGAVTITSGLAAVLDFELQKT